MHALRRYERAPVFVAFAAFALIGVSAGAGGVLLPAQIRDYAVTKTAIGATFFTWSAGFVVASFMTGLLIDRLGTRRALVLGAGLFIAGALVTAARPPFVAFVVVQAVAGYGTGVLESALNAFLAEQPDATPLLNRLHAFFGIGALLGPLLATWLLGFTAWTTVWLVLAIAAVFLMVGFHSAYPAVPVRPKATEQARGAELTTALRQRAVLLAATLLAVYVGLEIGVGNWGVSYLVDARGQHRLLAGYTLSGYWLGLTLGRFLISPLGRRVRLTPGGLLLGSISGVTVASALTWFLPSSAASIGFVVLGFFLGPVFPTTMALAPAVTMPRLVPTAIGVMNAGAVVGGSVLPWAAGAIGQSAGMWSLMPLAVALGGVQLVVCWWLLRSLRVLQPGPSEPAAAGVAHA